MANEEYGADSKASRIPIIHIYMRGGQIRYGQENKRGTTKPTLSKISTITFTEFINSRINRFTLATPIRVLSIAIPSLILLVKYLANDLGSASELSPLLLVAAIGFIIGQFIHVLETKARTTTLIFKLDKASRDGYLPFHEALIGLMRSDAIWSIATTTQTSDWKRNAGASNLLKRHLVNKKETPPFLKSDFQVIGISLDRHNGVHFFPDRLYFYRHGKYFLVEYQNCQIAASSTRFIENKVATKDSRQVDSTWQYVRKDGGPDRRFSNNRQLPVMEYCLVTFAFGENTKLEFHVSNLEYGLTFAQAFKTYGMNR